MRKHFNIALEGDTVDLLEASSTPPVEPAAAEPVVTDPPVEPAAVAEEGVGGTILGAAIGTVIFPVVGTVIGGIIGHHLSKEAMENLSMEEEQLLLDEAHMHASQAETHMSEIGRIMEISDALEDLAVISDGINNATPAEVALIENAGNLAVAGSDVDPGRVVPAMESFIGGRVAMEGIRETAKTIWENIKRFLVEVWKHIESFFSKMLLTIPRWRKSVERLQKEVAEAAAANKTIKAGVVFDATFGMQHLHVNGKPLTNETAILKAYATLTEAAQWVYGDYVKTVTDRGNVIASAIEGFDPADSGVSISKFRDDLKKFRAPVVPGGASIDKQRFPGFSTTMGNPLPGNVSIACKYFSDNADDITTLGALDRYRNSRCELIATTEVVPKMAAAIEVKPLSNRGMHDLLADMMKLLDILAAYKHGEGAKQVKHMSDKIVEASGKAERSFTTYSGKVEEHAEASTMVNIHYRAMLNFNASYTRWAQTPAVPMMRHAINMTKVMYLIVQKSLAGYE